jgi:hypothetical protein
MITPLGLLLLPILLDLSAAQSNIGEDPVALNTSWAHGGAKTQMGFATVSSGNVLVNKLYDTCVLYDIDGTSLAIGQDCVAQMLSYMMNAMTNAAYTVNAAIAAEEPGGVQESPVPTLRKRSEEHYLLKRVNHALARSSTPSLQAMSILPSSLLSRDSITTHLNVRNNGSTLSVHTNGTHATAGFASKAAISGRDLLPTNGQYVTFSGVSGLKVDAREMNGTLDGQYVQDLISLTDQFATASPGQSPNFKVSDSFTYTICNRTTTESLFYGSIIVEDSGAAFNYEPVYPLPCSTVNNYVLNPDQEPPVFRTAANLSSTTTAISTSEILSSASSTASTDGTLSSGSSTVSTGETLSSASSTVSTSGVTSTTGTASTEITPALSVSSSLSTTVSG